MEIWIVLLCLNIGINIVSVLDPAVPVKTPFNGSLNVTALAAPKIYNTTSQAGTLVKNETTNVLNSTGSGNSFFLFNAASTFFFPLAVLWNFVQFMTGGFAFAVLGIFGMPAVIVYSLQLVVGVLFARSILYYLTGR